MKGFVVTVGVFKVSTCSEWDAFGRRYSRDSLQENSWLQTEINPLQCLLSYIAMCVLNCLIMGQLYLKACCVSIQDARRLISLELVQSTWCQCVGWLHRNNKVDIWPLTTTELLISVWSRSWFVAHTDLVVSSDTHKFHLITQHSAPVRVCWRRRRAVLVLYRNQKRLPRADRDI